MRRLAAFTTILALALSSAPLFAAGATRASVGRAQNTGTVNGTAKSAQGQNLPNYTVRIRNLANGNIVGSSTTGAAGEYSFTGLPVGNYALEIVNASGDIIGTSASIAVAAGATVNVTVTASAAAALAEAAGAVAGGAGGAGVGGFSTALIITAVAVGAGIVGIVVATKTNDASPSR